MFNPFTVNGLEGWEDDELATVEDCVISTKKPFFKDHET